MTKFRLVLKNIIPNIRSLWEKDPSLRRHSLTFFLLFLLAIMFALLIILYATGVFSGGQREFCVFLHNELEHTAPRISREFNVLAVEGVILAQTLAQNLIADLRRLDIAPADLQNYPEQLELLLTNSLDSLIAALGKSKCSGAFLVLDATINPALPTANRSRAGIFLKNMEPNIVNVVFPTIRYLRGPVTIARKKGLDLLPQWQMEFSIAPDDFFSFTLNEAKHSKLPLSRLYYWNPATSLGEACEKAILLTIPLISPDGIIMGVCGFEISEMLFKLQHTPAGSYYTHTFAMLAPLAEANLDVSGALFAANYTTVPSEKGGFLTFQKSKKGLLQYALADHSTYYGIQKTINLYPKDAAFADTQWALALLIPQNNLGPLIMQQNKPILLLLLFLFALSISAGVFLSRRLIKPLVDTFERMKGDPSIEQTKTNIQEIDELVNFWASREKTKQRLTIREILAGDSTLLQNFINNIKTLSPAEENVFNLYLKGHSAKEAAEILYLSINTIKTHNKRIYRKLNVSSRKELMILIKMMQEKHEQSL